MMDISFYFQQKQGGLNNNNYSAKDQRIKSVVNKDISTCRLDVRVGNDIASCKQFQLNVMPSHEHPEIVIIDSDEEDGEDGEDKSKKNNNDDHVIHEADTTSDMNTKCSTVTTGSTGGTGSKGSILIMESVLVASSDEFSHDQAVLNNNNDKEERKEDKTLRNPFAQFAYHSQDQQIQSLHVKRINHVSTLFDQCKRLSMTSLTNSNDIHNKSTSIKVSVKSNKKRKRTHSTCTISKKKEDKEVKDIPYDKMTKEEKDMCKQKWHTFADIDAPIETRRFQVLIAARLHCQAHESVVRSAMDALKAFIATSNTCDVSQKKKQLLDVYTLSNADSAEVASVISSVLFANTKAKQIVKAAKEVKMKFRGIVPETKLELQSITGIGPIIADMLYHLNSYKDHYDDCILLNSE